MTEPKIPGIRADSAVGERGDEILVTCLCLQQVYLRNDFKTRFQELCPEWDPSKQLVVRTWGKCAAPKLFLKNASIIMVAYTLICLLCVRHCSRHFTYLFHLLCNALREVILTLPF